MKCCSNIMHFPTKLYLKLHLLQLHWIAFLPVIFSCLQRIFRAKFRNVQINLCWRKLSYDFLSIRGSDSKQKPEKLQKISCCTTRKKWKVSCPAIFRDSGVFSKWSGTFIDSVNSGNSENLRNHWSMNWVQYKDLLYYLCLCGLGVTI